MDINFALCLLRKPSIIFEVLIFLAQPVSKG